MRFYRIRITRMKCWDKMVACVSFCFVFELQLKPEEHIKSVIESLSCGPHCCCTMLLAVGAKGRGKVFEKTLTEMTWKQIK